MPLVASANHCSMREKRAPKNASAMEGVDVAVVDVLTVDVADVEVAAEEVAVVLAAGAVMRETIEERRVPTKSKGVPAVVVALAPRSVMPIWSMLIPRCRSRNTVTLPCEEPSEPENASSAMPTESSNGPAFLPTPGTEEGAMRSPMAMGPPSRFTFAGTRPESATGRCPVALGSPKTWPGIRRDDTRERRTLACRRELHTHWHARIHRDDVSGGDAGVGDREHFRVVVARGARR